MGEQDSTSAERVLNSGRRPADRAGDLASPRPEGGVDRDVQHAEALTEADITREIPGFGRGTAGPKPKTTSTIYTPSTADEPEFRLPEAGQSFLGFRLERELGRGAVGRVFLA